MKSVYTAPPLFSAVFAINVEFPRCVYLFAYTAPPWPDFALFDMNVEKSITVLEAYAYIAPPSPAVLFVNFEFVTNKFF